MYKIKHEGNQLYWNILIKIIFLKIWTYLVIHVFLFQAIKCQDPE